jgi:hypothetical protein
MSFWGKTLLTRHTIHDPKLVCRRKCIKVSKQHGDFVVSSFIKLNVGLGPLVPIFIALRKLKKSREW